MKKITALLLALLMVISMMTFSSCDMLEEYIPGISDMLGFIEENKEPRTTITVDEWLSTWDSQNFTVHTLNGRTIYYTGSAYKEVKDTNPDWIYTFNVLEDGVWYGIIPYNGEWWHRELEESEFAGLENLTPAHLLFKAKPTEELFNQLTYDEETKTYKNGPTEFYFEDGLLVYMKIDGKIMLENVGTTVIDVPSHKLWVPVC